MSKSLPIVCLPPTRFSPSKETLSVLNERQWVCSYSGGKDSTALVTWIEYLRRIGWVKVDQPRLVQSDTGVEWPLLGGISEQLTARLREYGWVCDVVRPLVKDRLYCQIFGRGLCPVHPGGRKMRWCSRTTKIKPMEEFNKSISKDVIQLSGVRWGESVTRDGKLRLGGCEVGGECGLPEVSEQKSNTYGPIINWKTCQVYEWIGGDVDVSGVDDLTQISSRLLDVYDVKQSLQQNILGEAPPKVSQMRFGCIGCPAISNEKVSKSKEGRRNPAWQHVERIYQIWDRIYSPKCRCVRWNQRRNRWSPGPIKMEIRKSEYAEFLKIQADLGITLVTPEEDSFIRQCWVDKVYPHGWSEADEATVEPVDDGLFQDTK